MSVNKAIALIAAFIAPEVAHAQGVGNWYAVTSASARAVNSPADDAHPPFPRRDESDCEGVSPYCQPGQGYLRTGTTPYSYSAASAVGNIRLTGTPADLNISEAESYVNPVTGKIGIFVDSVSGTRSYDVGASAQAIMFDTLTFSSLIAGLYEVPVRLSVSGDYSGSVQPRFGFALQSSVELLSTSVGWSGNGTAADAANFIDFGRSGTWLTYGPNTWQGKLLVDSKNPAVTIFMNLTAGGSTETGNIFAGFDHTAGVQFDLPAGVSFTSASGVFLTDNPSAVPEMTLWTMMVAGFGAAGSALRRKRNILTTVAYS